MIRSEVDFDAQGKHVGFLRLAHSTHQSAYGWIPIPVASIRNGDGPTVLVMAGNHGDEYEGQVLASQLVRQLQPEMLRGQVILLPMANFPAAQAGQRTSPIDGGNLNRLFPGNPAGTITEEIAAYVETQLVKRSSVVVDLHSGGSSLLYNGPTMLALEPRDAAESQRIRGLLQAFGLPRAFLHAPNPVTISSAARRQGAISIVTELGGAGMITPAILRIARQGLLHLLGQVGVLQGELVPPSPPGATRIMRIDAAAHYVYARENGLFEPLVELGDTVTAGQAVARIHFPETPWREPEAVHAVGAGEVICKRVPALSRRGDCLFQLAQDHVEG
jgi:predicted deacylase